MNWSPAHIQLASAETVISRLRASAPPEQLGLMLACSDILRVALKARASRRAA
jgi:hypothetical protein